jgi:hypothetical protein
MLTEKYFTGLILIEMVRVSADLIGKLGLIAFCKFSPPAFKLCSNFEFLMSVLILSLTINYFNFRKRSVS